MARESHSAGTKGCRRGMPLRPPGRAADDNGLQRGARRGRATAGVIALSLIAQGAVMVAGSDSASAAPGTPGVPQAPTTVYTENFEHGTGNTPIELTNYTGASGEKYTADPAWLTACNGYIFDFSSTGNGNCSSAGSANGLRQLAWALGSFAGATTPADNHAVGAYTETNPGANLIQFETVNPIPLTATNRFLTFSVDYAAQNCGVSAPLPQFYLTNGSTETPVGGVINACSSGTTVTAPAVGGNAATSVNVGSFPSSGSVLFSGSSVGLRMRNTNGSGTGNDGAFDNIKILDATPQLDKSFSPASVPQGKTSTLTFTVTNTTEKASKNGWSFTDALPAGMTVAASPASSTTCPSGVVTAASGGSSVAVTGNLSSGMDSCTVSVPVTSASVANYTNGPSNVTTTGLNPPGSANVAFTTAVDLTVTKTANPSPKHVPGSPLTYTVTVHNAGPSAAVNATVADPLPAALASATWTCAPSTGSSCAATGTGNIHDTVSVAKGGTVTYTITGTVPPDQNATLTNTATVTPPAGVYDENCDPNCSATATTTAEPTSNVTTLKETVSTAAVHPGQTVEYKLTATNQGPSTAVNVGAHDPLPAHIAFVSSADGCTGTVGQYGGTVTCGTVASLAPHASQSWTFTAKLDPSYTGDGSDLVNTATATSATCPNGTCPPSNPTPLPGPNTPLANITTVKSTSATAPVLPGQTFDYTLTSTNNGPSTATTVGTSDPLPAPMAFVSSADGCTGTVGQYGGTVTCGTVASLAVGANHAWTFTVRLDPSYTGDGSDLGNIASATSSTCPNGTCPPSNPVPPPGPNTPKADLTTVKSSAGNSPLYPGETFTYTVTTTNNGPSTAVNAGAVDPLPAQVAFVSSTDGCTGPVGQYGGTVTCGGTTSLTPPPPPGNTASWTFTVRINPSYKGDGTDIVNIATATSSTPGTKDPSGPVGPPPISPPKADLTTVKTTNNTSPVHPGQTVTYVITTTNQGPSTAENVGAGDLLAAPLSFVSSPNGCTAAGQQVTCGTTATLAPGASASWTFTAMLSPSYTGDGKDLANTATATSDTPGQKDPSTPIFPPGPNTPLATLTTVKTATTNTPVRRGQTFDYQVTVTNQGPSTALNVGTSDKLPATLSFVSSASGCTGPVGTYGGTVTCGKQPTLAVGAKVSWTFTVRVSPTAPGDGSAIVNTASATSDTPGDHPGSDPAHVPGGRLAPDAPATGDGSSQGSLPGTGDLGYGLLIAALATGALLARRSRRTTV